MGSFRADVASIFEEYACTNIVVRRPPFPVAPLMTARFQRGPPVCLGLQDCHLRDLLLSLCRSAPLSLVLGFAQILPSLLLEFDFRLLLLLQASYHSALPRVLGLSFTCIKITWANPADLRSIPDG